MSSSLFSQTTISKIKSVHKVFLWVATGVLIASLLLGAILIFVDTDNDLFGKIHGTFFIMAAAAFICVNNFIRIEKGNKLVQGFALTGFVANVVWLILGVLMIWGALSPVQAEISKISTNNMSTQTYGLHDEYNYDDYNSSFYNDLDMEDVYRDMSYPTSYTPTTHTITIGARILIVALSLAAIGFWVSNILVIKDKVKAVKLLKIVAIICEVYGSLFVIVVALVSPISINQNLLKWAELSGLASSGFIVTTLAAWVISRTHKDFDSDVIEAQPKPAEPILVTGSVNEELSKIVKNEPSSTEHPPINNNI